MRCTLVLLTLIFSLCSLTNTTAGQGSCASAQLVESLPEELDLPSPSYTIPTDLAWAELINSANHTLTFGAFYWSLSAGEQLSAAYGASRGARVLELIRSAAVDRGVKVRVIQNQPGPEFKDSESRWLKDNAGAEIMYIDFRKLGLPQITSGVFHTKVIISDSRDLYLGSANMDWRSISQVKETGVMLRGCPEMAEDAEKIIEAFTLVAKDGKVPETWPQQLQTKFDHSNPLIVKMGNDGRVVPMYLAASPLQICTSGRADATDSTLRVIHEAKKSISVEVMDYAPTSYFISPNVYWPIIDDALRAAAFRGVKIRLLFSLWNHTKPAQAEYAKSLAAIKNVQVKFFKVPDLKNLPPVPFTRVNHSKFMVTESVAYITTSNWSADYFLTTAGINAVIGCPVLTHQLQSLFDRDWNSPYTTTVA